MKNLSNVSCTRCGGQILSGVKHNCPIIGNITSDCDCKDCRDVVGKIEFENDMRSVKKIMKKPDNINHPAHYAEYKIEVADAIDAWMLNHNRASAIEYIVRAGRKSKDTEIEDLRKARWRIEREIKRLEK